MVDIESVLRRHVSYASYLKMDLAEILGIEAYVVTKKKGQEGQMGATAW